MRKAASGDASLRGTHARPRRPTSRDTRRRLAVAVVLLAAAFSVATYSAPVDEDAVLRSALGRAADRLLALQQPDGSFPKEIGLAGDLSASGRPARALLGTYVMLRDERYLAGAERAANAILAEVRRSRRAASHGNLLFLAAYGRTVGRADVVSLAATLRAQELARRGTLDGAAAAGELLARPNRTDWHDGAWRNYALWHAGEQADLARAVGDPRWADEFTVAVASSWAPKHDYAFAVMAAGRMLESLAKVPGAEARRLAEAELASLRNAELLPGLPWNDTPYDRYVYALEASAAIQGMLCSSDPAARRAGIEGACFLAHVQGRDGGWASTLPLTSERPDPHAGPVVPPAQLAVEETPDIDAEVVLTLLYALHAREQELEQAATSEPLARWPIRATSSPS